MASTYREDNPYLEDGRLAHLEILVPPFPEPGAIADLLPGIVRDRAHLSKTDFLPWVDTTLDGPDEVWESDGPFDQKVLHYLNFIDKTGSPPVFAVAVVGADDFTQICDYSIIIRQSDLERVCSGQLLYSRVKEWETEKMVRDLNDRALVKYDEGNLDEARALVDAAVEICGNGNAYLFNNRGLICWKMGDTEQAKKDFLQSIRLDGSNGDSNFNIGLIYFDESDHRHALEYLRRAVEINPGDSQFLMELGHLYLEMSREVDALKLFDRALENNPDDPQVDFHLGYYYLYKKRTPRNAVKYYKKGLKKDPDDQFAMVDLAVAHWQLGNKRKTREIRHIVQEYQWLMPYTINRLVYLNLEMEEYDNALDFYRQALAQSEPFEPEWLHYYAAVVYAKTGRVRQALRTLNLAVRAGGETVVRRAMSEKALQDLKETPSFTELLELAAPRDNQ